MLPAHVGLLVLLSSSATCMAPPVGDSPTGNIHLFVSNQSFDRPLADITVLIDGEVAYREQQPVEDQHRWDRTELALAPGMHLLRARENDVGVAATADFQVPSQSWLLVQYWTDPPRFTIDVSEQEFMFD